MLDKLEAADFEKHLNEEFYIHREDGKPIKAKLVSVTDRGTPGEPEVESHHRNAFSLLFRAHGQHKDVSASYKLEHGKMGTLDLFLTNVAPDDEKDKGDYYEAIFT